MLVCSLFFLHGRRLRKQTEKLLHASVYVTVASCEILLVFQRYKLRSVFSFSLSFFVVSSLTCKKPSRRSEAGPRNPPTPKPTRSHRRVLKMMTRARHPTNRWQRRPRSISKEALKVSLHKQQLHLRRSSLALRSASERRYDAHVPFIVLWLLILHMFVPPAEQICDTLLAALLCLSFHVSGSIPTFGHNNWFD